MILRLLQREWGEKEANGNTMTKRERKRQIQIREREQDERGEKIDAQIEKH